MWHSARWDGCTPKGVDSSRTQTRPQERGPVCNLLFIDWLLAMLYVWISGYQFLTNRNVVIKCKIKVARCTGMCVIHRV